MNKFFVALALSVAVLSAAPLSVGSPITALESLRYETPMGNEIEIPKNTKLIIAVFEKDMGAFVNEFLDAQNPLYLLENNSIFIADVHKTPSFFINMFALPKLKKYKHPIYLHYEEKLQEAVLNKEQKITLLHIEDSKIKDITFISTQEELKTAIEK